jgi:hypothetical protein
LALPLFLAVASNASAGELENELLMKAMKGLTDEVHALIDKGANIDKEAQSGGSTALLHFEAGLKQLLTLNL